MTNRPKWIIFWCFITIISLSNGEGLPTMVFGPKPKGTIKTIDALEVGDIIDCVDIYKQPAFDNPLVKDLKFKMPPIHLTSINKTSKHKPLFIQTWTKFGRCPEGTIPIRRTPYNNGTMHNKYSNDDRRTREYATVFQFVNKGRGGRAYFNAWTQRLGNREELSISQMWVSSGQGAIQETAEVGWMVHPNLYGDEKTRLFVLWSRENYQKACYNTMCLESFVHTDPTIALGAELDNSIYNGKQESIRIGLTRTENGDWEVEIGNQLLGFFPRQLFNKLGDGADSIDFGGEIKNLATGGHHTTTTMGSGHFSTEGYRKACFIRNIQLKNQNFEWVEPRLQVRGITRPSCYDLTFGPPQTKYGAHFYFGGPGFSEHCQ